MRRFLFVALVMVAWTGSGVAETPKRLLLLSQGPDGHPPQTHEYAAGLQLLEQLLKKSPGLEMLQLRADDPWREGPELLQRADGVVLFLSEGARWLQNEPKRLEAFQRLAARGGGFTVIHWGMGAREAKHIDSAVKLLGGCHGGPDRKYKVVDTSADLPDQRHPIVTGIKPFKVRDEFYYQLKFAQPTEKVKPILRVRIDNAAETVAWAWERPEGGRSFGFSGLHFHENWKVPEYRRLMVQGVLWSLKLPIPADGAPIEAGPTAP